MFFKSSKLKNFLFVCCLYLASTAFSASYIPQTTAEMHKINGVYTASRRNMHEEIASRIAAEGRSSSDPFIIVVGGAPGSGKTHFIQLIQELGLVNANYFIQISADRLKEEIPEYHRQLRQDKFRKIPFAAQHVHDESVDIRTLLFFHAVEINRNIILETAFTDKVAIEQSLADLRRQKPEYKVIFIHINSDGPLNEVRIENRNENSERMVDPQIGSQSVDKSKSTFQELRALADYSLELENPATDIIEVRSVSDQRSVRSGLRIPLQLKQPLPQNENNPTSHLVGLIVSPEKYLHSECQSIWSQSNF